MKKGRFREEQIIGVLKQHEAGCQVPKLTREIGVRRPADMSKDVSSRRS
jgi:hypothetical protein